MADFSSFLKLLDSAICFEQQRSPNQVNTHAIVAFPRLLPDDVTEQRELWYYLAVGDERVMKEAQTIVVLTTDSRKSGTFDRYHIDYY